MIYERALRLPTAISTPKSCTAATCVCGNYLRAARAGKTLYEVGSCHRGRFLKMSVRDGTLSRRGVPIASILFLATAQGRMRGSGPRWKEQEGGRGEEARDDSPPLPYLPRYLLPYLLPATLLYLFRTAWKGPPPAWKVIKCELDSLHASEGLEWESYISSVVL